MSDTEQLMKKKNQIEEAKSKQSEIKGKSETIEAQIQDKFNIEISDIDSELEERGAVLDKKEEGFKEKLEVLNGAYSWN